jgi:hypothetical protein
LFVWTTSQTAAHMLFTEFAVTSVGSSKSPTSTAFRFIAGVVQSTFATLLFYGAGDIPGLPGQQAVLTGTNLDLGAVTDTVTVRDTVHWFLGGTGVRIGRGSEVRVMGGRIIGPAVRTDGTIGVHVTGNNGGVHIAETGAWKAGTRRLGMGVRADGGVGRDYVTWQALTGFHVSFPPPTPCSVPQT